MLSDHPAADCIRFRITHENVTRVKIIPGDEDRYQKQKQAHGFRVAAELTEKNRKPIRAKLGEYQGQEENNQQRDHEKIKRREHRCPVIDEQFYGVSSYHLG